MNVVKVKLVVVGDFLQYTYEDEAGIAASAVARWGLAHAAKDSGEKCCQVFAFLKPKRADVGVVVGAGLHVEDAYAKLVAREGETRWAGWLGAFTAFGYTEGAVETALKVKAMKAMGVLR